MSTSDDLPLGLPTANTPTAVAATQQDPAPAAIPAATPLASHAILPASHWIQEPLLGPEPAENDADSTLGDDVASSTASLSSSILEYRIYHGRTFAHQVGLSDTWGPNDSKHLQSLDMSHYLTLLTLKDKLYLSPLDKKVVKKAVDIGCGCGAWAIDFADEFPAAQVIGTDVSPTQPAAVPPNLRFEIEDCNQDWTWPEHTFDFVHMCNMTGSLVDWPGVFKNAYRCCKPGGWFESHETSSIFASDDGTVLPNSPMDQWGKVFSEAGPKFGRTFRPIEDGLQKKSMIEAGFVDIQSFDFKCPFGTWAQETRLKTIGTVARHVLDCDLEGYTLYLWSTVMGWTTDEIHVFIAHLRRQLRDPKVHSYTKQRIVYGRKPLASETS